MFDSLKKYLRHHFHHPNYFYFMVSLILLILVPPFSELIESRSLLLNSSFGLVILMGIFYTTANFNQFITFSILGVILFVLFVIAQQSQTFSFWNPIMTAIFFLGVFRNLIQHIFRVEKIGLNEVYASIAGYLVLGIMVTPFFFLIEQSIPHSFKLPEDTEFYDFMYFSYITLTTIGYGDITPVHHIAKSFTILVGIFGQLYLTILVAIIIGKYLAIDIERKKSSKKD